MGCHTWIYKKVSALTKEEKDKFVNEKRQEASSWWGFKKTHQEIVEEVSTWNKKMKHDVLNGKTPEQYATELINEYTSRRNKYLNGTFETILNECIKDGMFSRYKVINDTPYFEIECDLFRVWGYPEDTFTNVDSLLEWLKTTTNKIGFFDENKDYEFVEGYTNELENEIKEYFHTHGEDNLFIEFG